jgi:hypothetical protein
MRVKLQNLDDSSRSYFDARTLEIQISSKTTIETPFRALSNNELSAKASIPSEIVLPGEIAGVHEDLSEAAVKDILTDHPTNEKLIKSIENYRNRMQHSEMIFSLLQPGKHARDLHLTDPASKEKFLDLNLLLQKMANYNTLCVPWVDYDSPKTAIQSIKRIENIFDEELIFFLDTAWKPIFLEEVSEYLIELIDAGRIHFIGVLYEPPDKKIGSYYTLWKKFREKDVAIILANLPRINENFYNISSLHLNEFILGDIFLPKQPKFFSKKKTEEEKTKPTPPFKIEVKEKIQIFNPEQLTLSSLGTQQNDSWIENMSKVIGDPQIKKIIENYFEAETNLKKFKTLNSVSKIHEFIESTKEIKKSKNFIKTGESVEYLNEKEILNKSLKKTIAVEKKYQKKLS